MKALELPAGAGGMALGLHRAGIEAVALVEWDPSACATLRAAVAEGRLCGEVVEADCSELDYSRWRGVDLVCGGPPCQPFSGAGKGLGEHDDRDGFPWFLRAVEEVAPRYVLIENVRGLLFEKHAAYLAGILQQLEALGFVVKIGLLNCADFGVPQTRERVFIWGARHGEAMPDWPQPTHADPRKGLSLFGLPSWVSAGEAVGVGGMIQINGQTSEATGGERVVCERTGDLPAFAVRAGSRAGSRGDNAKCRLETMSSNPSRREMREGLPSRTGKPRWTPGPAGTVGTLGSSHQCRIETIGQLADYLNAPSRTISADQRLSATCRHDPDEPNSQSLRLESGEVFRAPWQWRAAWQAFPPDWPWRGAQTHIDRQIGNALPPLMAEHLGRVLMDAGETTEGASPEGARG